MRFSSGIFDRWLVGIFFALALTLVWSGAGIFVARDQAQVIAREEARMVSLARAFAEHAQASIQRVDAILLNLRERRFDAPDSFATEVERQNKSLTGFSTLVGIIDENGMVTFNSQDPAAKPIYSGDRAYYQELKRATADRLVIGSPILGRISGKWSIQLSRKLRPDGPFKGVVFVSIDPLYYARFYDSLNLGAESSVAIVHDRGEVLTRHPFNVSFMGAKVPAAPYLAANPPAQGTYRRGGIDDGVERLIGFARLPQYGVTLIVAQKIDTILEGVKHRRQLTIAFAVFLTAIFSLMFWAIFRNIVARERAEQTTRTLNAQLEQRVAERTAQLETANQELEAFTYSVSHDLKAPLRGINGYGSLLNEEFGASLGEAGRTYISHIRRAASQMDALITDMLAYAHIERDSSSHEAFDLAALLASLVEEKHADIAACHAEVTISAPALTLTADQSALTMALRNLLDNALKFARGAQNPCVELGAENRDASVLIWVKDNGVGFDMAYHDKVFKLFQRLHRLEEYGGTGVGLAIVSKAMERIGGRVWAESAPGKGATFFLEVPK